MIRLLIAVVGSLFGASTWAVCLNPFGCEPRNYDECVQAASKAPTETGVRFAVRNCWERHRKPEADRQRVAWERVTSGTGVTLAEVIKAMGRHDIALPVGACTPPTDAKSTAASGMCRAYGWADKRSGDRDCFNQRPCYYMLEVTDAGDSLWVYWAVPR
jgi:hypothetical protein